MDNVTLVANRAGSGGIAYQELYNGDWIEIFGFDGVGGGLLTFGLTDTLTLRNSILANNNGAGTDCAGTITLQGYNLIQNTADCTITGAGEQDQLGQDPLLLDLAAFGGATLVHHPAYLSPAVDSGSCTDSQGAVVAVDQYGTVRPVAATCDIGATKATSLPGLAFLALIER